MTAYNYILCSLTPAFVPLDYDGPGMCFDTDAQVLNFLVWYGLSPSEGVH